MNAHLARSVLFSEPGFLLRLANLATWADVVQTLEPVGLKPQAYATLVIIDATPGCKQQDVADALGIQRPNQVALVDGLVERGLVCREVNAQDRRSYSLRLTCDGCKLLETARRLHDAHLARVSVALNGVDQELFAEALWRLAHLTDTGATDLCPPSRGS